MRSTFGLILLLAVSAIALAGSAGGCYDTPRPACAFHCGQSGECPDGYGCRADDWCKRDDVPADFQCEGPLIDAAPLPPDAHTPDAGPDAAAPDASAI